jgi:putative transposase
MGNKRIEDRQRAIQRYRQGERPANICASMGYSRRWFYKWLHRANGTDAEWPCDQSRRPHQCPTRSGRELEQSVTLVRLSLSNRGLFCGAQAIRWELEDLAVTPLPSLRTINRLLARNELTHRRTGRYQAKGTPYPRLMGTQPGDVHQTDFVGPCYLTGPVRFYRLHSVDLVTGRCAVEPLRQRAGQHTVNALWATWTRLGMPRHQQVDNEMVFYGSPVHPRGMGLLIRLCLPLGLEPWFIPPSEPWRNGVVEQFNDHWRQKFLARTRMWSAAELKQESRHFEQRHNRHYRYSKLGGKTPGAALEASGVPLRFPPTPEAPRVPLPKPHTGRYHLVRLIRSDGLLDVFGEKFPVPPETIYEYVRATVDVERQCLGVSLDDRLVDEHPYSLRRC